MTTRKHSPIELLRDNNGDPLHVSDLQTFETRYLSSNWSGYILPKFRTNKHYTAAQATWTVPTVTFHGSQAFSSSWIGIGGFCTSAKCNAVDQTLIQLGTEQDAISSTEKDYFAWYELLPDVQIPTTLAVSPGDVITASLSCAGDCSTGQWTLSMNNETTAMTWSQDFTYASPNLSVEVIEEAPAGQNKKGQFVILPLANFGKATFSETTADSMSVDFSKGDSIVMEDLQTHHRTASSNVSSLASTLDGFNACFHSGKSLAACTKP